MRTATKYLSMLMVILSILIFVSQTKAQIILVTEGWESAAIGSTPPANWAVDQLGYSNWISWDATGSFPTAMPYEGSRMTIFNSWTAPAGNQNRLRRTLAISTIGYSNISVDFAEYNQATFTGGDGITIQWSTDGVTWTSAGSNWSNYNPSVGWVVHTQTLPAGASNQATLYVAYLFTSQYGYDVYMDITHVTGTQTGNMTGTARNCISNAVLSGASVSCGGAGPVLTSTLGVYTLTGCNAGSQTMTATLAGYTLFSQPVTVVANTTTTFNFCMYPLPGVLTGVVTNCANGIPVIGAKVSWGTYYTYTVTGGLYSLNVYSTGPDNLQATKEGFNNYSQTGVTVTYPAPPNTTVNICMTENTPPPSAPFVAALNGGQTQVNLNWGLPVDDMVLLYDDGIQDNFAIWATGSGNNMIAMKFTPISYPAIIKKFYLNIGTALNYPSGSNAFSPVQFDIYNETPAGIPGTSMTGGNTTTITPSLYGWSEFSFATPVNLSSGNFFIVMIQMGNSTLSPGIAIDTTVQQLRSYSKFGATGSWLPGPGNYMIRAVVSGSGGPLMMGDQPARFITASPVPGLIYQYVPATVSGTEGVPKVYDDMGLNPDNILGYQVWRLLQGQQTTPALWTSVGTPATTGLTDNSWPSLACGAYMWAAETQYTFNRWSTPTFSNVLGKCWTCTVIVNVSLSCDSASNAGTIINFQNLAVTDTVYNYVMGASGSYTFQNFWKGNYTLTVSKFGYSNYVQTPISIMGDMTINVSLLQLKTPPSNLYIFDTDALATWNPPLLKVFMVNEAFTTGFATNGWVVDPGLNTWYISAVNGNPGQCAEFSWSPEVQNYSQAFTSKTLYGVNSDILNFQFDVYLNNFGNTTLEELAAEVYDGTTWHQVAHFDNSSNQSIPWTTITNNIASIAPSDGFKVRFRTYGLDSFNINNWDIDNVKVYAQTVPHDPCVIGYNFYLNGALDGVTPDTFYNIPPSHLVYGTSYHACVSAVYGSGYSAQICADFISHFLCPPDTVTATPLECSVDVTWQKPNCGGCTLATITEDSGIANDAMSFYANVQTMQGNIFPITPATNSGTIKSFDAWFSQYSTCTTQSCILYIYNPAFALIGQSLPFMNGPVPSWPSGAYINIPIPDVAYTGSFYGMIDYYSTVAPKNGLGLDNQTIPSGYPVGYGFVNQSGTFSPAKTALGYSAPAINYILRANVCKNGKDKDAPLTTIDPAPVYKNLKISGSMSTGNIQDVFVGNPVTTDAPAANPVLLGYNVYRNNVQIGTTNSPDSMEFFDYNLNPATYHYKVAARYNTSPYNPPLFLGYSRPGGPATVSVSCGFPIPFLEPWTTASFSYQQWTFAPGQGNWIMNTAVGDPTPCADFSWQPVANNYSFSLVSPSLNASAWTCANLYCDFDVKLVDRNSTGAEKLDFDLLIKGTWINIAEMTNTGSFDWTLKHVDITNLLGKSFKIRFRANGTHSDDIMHWYVDNINVYGVCSAPQTLHGQENQFTTNLSWTAPACPQLGPSPQWIHWDDGTNAQSIGYGSAAHDWQMAARWIPQQIYQLDGGSITKINFFPAGMNTTFRARIWEGADAANLVVDQPIPTVTVGQWNTVVLATPHPVDISQELWVGIFVHQTAGSFPGGADAGPAIVGYGDMFDDGSGAGFVPMSLPPNNLNYNWNIEAYVAPGKKSAYAEKSVLPKTQMNAPAGFVFGTSGKVNNSPNRSFASGSGRIENDRPLGSKLMGYNIYRTDDNQTTGFHMLNISPWFSGVTYPDLHPVATADSTTWRYFVTALFVDSLNQNTVLCEPSSDTITIMFPAVGLTDLSKNSLEVYPNPANEYVNVVSTDELRTIDVLNYLGQKVYFNNDVNLKATKLYVNGFNPGVYFVKVTTLTGIKTTKITITH